MRVFVRHNLARGDDSPDEKLLLEGSWPGDEQRPGHWSLDDAVDARFQWLDPLAMDLAQRAGGSHFNFAHINALALRYYLVKLLRVIAFFHHVRPVPKGDRLALHAAAGDEDYVELFGQLASAHGLELELQHQPATSNLPARARRSPLWRQWAAGAVHARRPPVADVRNERPRVALCGNPRILNPICAELVSRGARVAWLYERFAARSWWRWRAAGVEQLICESGPRGKASFSDVSSAEELVVEGIDLTRPVDRWLARRAWELGGRQSLLVERVESHLRRLRPAAILVDEDATPLKRIAVAMGRLQGAASLVVQHGAPCGPFGFLPLAADKIAVWGVAAERQLQTWGLPAERIEVAGWPQMKPPAPLQAATNETSVGTAQAKYKKRFLLLATLRPRDERPDNIEFHLTAANYRAMLEMVCAVLGKIANATLIIKPHPRDARAALREILCQTAAGERPRPPIKIVRTQNLSELIAASDCVLSCASTAGIEAALAGAPVIQLLPAGSGNILPAEDWGLIGSARTADELAQLIASALARGWRHDSQATAKVLVAHGRAAAARIVDGVFKDAPMAVESEAMAGK